MAHGETVVAKPRLHGFQLLQALWSQRRRYNLLAGAVLMFVAQYIYNWIIRRRSFQQWKRHIDFSVVQACLLSTEHLKTLGRIEKRTLFVKPLAEVFPNEFIQQKVLEKAEKAHASGDGILVTHFNSEDKWHVLNNICNYLSSLFAPYHIFFNEARRADSYYKSAWYCFTLTCAQTSAEGRWMITPYKPVGVEDIGMLRIRIMLMNEQELRDIASGAIEPPSFGFCNGRHECRWKTCLRFAELFSRQVRHVTGSANTADADWGPNLNGWLQAKRTHGLNRRNGGNSQTMLQSMEQRPVPEYDAEDNCILRIHIPFPTHVHKELGTDHPEAERKTKDVVLFE